LVDLGKKKEASQALENLLQKMKSLNRGLRKSEQQSSRDSRMIEKQLKKTEDEKFIFDVRFLYAKTLHELKNYQDALFQYRLVARILDENSQFMSGGKNEIYYNQALCYYSLLDIDKASELLQRNIDEAKQTSGDKSDLVRNMKFLIRIYKKTLRPIKAIGVYLDSQQMDISEDQHQSFNRELETMLHQELNESQLKKVFLTYKEVYPGNVALDRLVQMFEQQQRYKDCI